MNLILHHLRKDIRAQRWLLALSFLMVVLRIVVDLLETQPDYRLASTAEFVRATMALSLTGGVLWILLLARLVLSEPVTGTASFWLTRPVPRGVYLPSKLIFILLFLVLPYLIPVPLDMFHFGVEPWRIWSSLKLSLLIDGYLAIIILWFATYSRALTQFWVILIVAAVVASVIGAMAVYWQVSLVTHGPRGGELMFSRWALFVLIFFSGLVVSLLMQHLRRKDPSGFIVGISGAVIAVLVVFLWPLALPIKFTQTFVFGITAVPPEKTTTIRFSDDWLQHLSWERNPETGQWLGLSVFSPAISTAPQTPIVQGIHGTFQPIGGEPERLSNDITGYIPADGQFDVEKAIEADLPGIHLSNQPGPAGIGSLSLFVIHPAEEQLIGKTGELSLSVYGHLQSLVREAGISLDGPGLARQPGEIIHVAQLPGIPGPFVVDRVDKPVLAVWILGYFGQEQLIPPARYFLLVDPEKRTGTFLFTDNGAIGGGFIGLSGKTSRHFYLPLAGQEPLDRRMLYIYELKPADFFNASVGTPNFTMSPKL